MLLKVLKVVSQAHKEICTDTDINIQTSYQIIRRPIEINSKKSIVQLS